MPDQRFPRKLRLRQRSDFDRVYRCNAYAADQVLVVSVCANHRQCARLGLSVSRKVGGAAARNRWKRLIREAFRRGRTRMPTGIDLVVRPRRGAIPDFQAVCQSLPRLTRRAAARLAKEQP